MATGIYSKSVCLRGLGRVSLTTVSQQEERPIRQILFLGNLLETCHFQSFWVWDAHVHVGCEASVKPGINRLWYDSNSLIKWVSTRISLSPFSVFQTCKSAHLSAPPPPHRQTWRRTGSSLMASLVSRTPFASVSMVTQDRDHQEPCWDFNYYFMFSVFFSHLPCGGNHLPDHWASSAGRDAGRPSG